MCIKVRAMIFRILLFYVLSILLIGLNGESHFPDIATHLTVYYSAMGLPKSIQQVDHYISFYHRIYPSWFK